MGRTWQDIRLFKSLDLADNIAAASPGCGDSPWSALFRPRRTRARTADHRLAASARLAALGLSGRDTSSADRVSLGQSKRVAIARALQADARVLFLDEPLAGLDADGIHDVLTHLRALAAGHGLTLVIIEHVLNIPRLLDFVSTVWTLENGHLTVATPDEVRQQTSDTASLTDIHALIRQALNREVPVTALNLPQGARLTTYWTNGTAAATDPPPVFMVQNLIIQRGPRRLWEEPDGETQGLNFTLLRGTVNVLEAPNGWGKTSFVNRVIGFLPAVSGSVTLQGTELPDSANGPAFHHASGRALLSGTSLFPLLSVAETAEIAGTPVQTDTPAQATESLSGGESRRVAIGCLDSASFYMLDEFFQGLDSSASYELLEHLVAQFPCHTFLFLQPATS